MFEVNVHDKAISNVKLSIKYMNEKFDSNDVKFDDLLEANDRFAVNFKSLELEMDEFNVKL